MAKTNWQDPKTSEMRSTHVSGLMEAVGKVEDSIGMESVFETNIPLTEVFISSDDRYRIFQAPEGKRNWTAEQPPVIKRNGVTISSGFEIDYGGGAIVLNVNDTVANTYTADVTYIKQTEISSIKTQRFVVGTSTSGWTEKDCDYLCDGTADQTEINAAINALPATGGEIVILDGTYNISTRIIVQKNNVSIMGNGDATVLKRGWNASSSASSEYRPIIFCGGNNCSISNLAIDGNKGIYTASTNTNISIEGSNNILTNISANNCASNSVWISGDFNKIICNKVIGNPNNSGIFLAGDFNIVCGNECRDNYYQINLNGANNNIITSNICIRGTGLPSDYGSSYATINLFGSTNNYNLIAMNNCMGKAVTSGGGTGNTLVNNKFDAT